MTPFTTLVALIAFAANSVLCRLALSEHELDANAFSLIRVLSGAATLLLLLGIKQRSFAALKHAVVESPKLLGVVSLMAYICFFSLAYVQLPTGIGALVLFFAVQMTMLGFQIYRGKQLEFAEWGGVILAFAGVIVLVSSDMPQPSDVESTSWFYILMMLMAGIAWGIYSILGKGVKDPLGTTTQNFVLGTLMALPIIGWWIDFSELTVEGVAYAVLSGSLASGVGYAVWYSALTKLKPVTAAISQLSVPLIASVGGLLVLSEPITMSFLISSVMVLVGICLVILSERKRDNG
ncbi:DMT family transporter [Vibrio maerlii]|uniref:DMT family transporter n=1 Tax=Vibrio maerlii TaxID=2231648 RepID=UPI0013E02B89|nr:DMT family transporter [Vibrio maerlii]